MWQNCYKKPYSFQEILEYFLYYSSMIGHSHSNLHTHTGKAYFKCELVESLSFFAADHQKISFGIYGTSDLLINVHGI